MVSEKHIYNRKQYKTSLINNRRYLGNKYKLLPFIMQVIKKECKAINTIADIFAGTGAVSSAFQDKTLITNDLLYSNYICNYAWFGDEAFNPKVVSDCIIAYNSLKNCGENYMSRNFADTYFSRSDCAKIGCIRDDIEKKYKKNFINKKERAILITSLLYAMDKIATTCGHYDAYRKGADFENHLELYVPLIPQKKRTGNQCFNEDANNLVKRISADLFYLDPPYNSRQYCDAYHLLENVARWEKPEVYGVAKKMDRQYIKSQYCTKNATKAFELLINDIKSKYIILSYNNMATKGDSRSNAKISDKEIIRILENKGVVKAFNKRYKPFSAGKSNISENIERLFVCICF